MSDSLAPPAHHALLLIGGGGHAVVIAEAAHLAGMQLRGFLDDYPAAPLGAVLIETPGSDRTVLTPSSLAQPVPRHLGTLESLQHAALGPYIIALGNIQIRRQVLDALGKFRLAMSSGTFATPSLSPHALGPHALGPQALGPQSLGQSATPFPSAAATVVHPSAFISPTARLASGVFIGPSAIVHARARVGPHAIINSGAIVEHDCTIGENTHLAPGSVIGGTVTIGSDTLLGLGCRVLPGLFIGKHCTIGAGAVVLASVPDGTTVVGVYRG